MGTLRYAAITSLDGYTADADGVFDWARPSPEVHAAVNELERETRVSLLGRRMYEVLKVWQDVTDTLGEAPAAPVEREYAEIWRGYDKVVYSTTLPGVDTPRTRLEHSFDPAAVRELVERTEGVVTIGGAGLAAHALRAGLVDEVQLFVSPVAVGGGTAAMPEGLRLNLILDGVDTFSDGVVRLVYGTR
ncbi:dihydrofolate reductase family protein [Myceligenerans indicum]|uniref:Dihydrofolate reductase family protein n=1 Tax=Myceligenerans indicum TaxID=2593663 RepID=A0ABS1LGA0_9MICO|nr:dihydrofolate reductase family protein [Myceligenerans indicum]MBL0885184.1 dihydrofolate reductase family protein [Myceligenerans indicum]